MRFQEEKKKKKDVTSSSDVFSDLRVRRNAASVYLPWTCAICTFENKQFPSICEACDEDNPEYKVNEKKKKHIRTH